jgi:hypothetical protein
MLSAEESIHATSADQDQAEHLCCLVMDCTVRNSISTYLKFYLAWKGLINLDFKINGQRLMELKILLYISNKILLIIIKNYLCSIVLLCIFYRELYHSILWHLIVLRVTDRQRSQYVRVVWRTLSLFVWPLMTGSHAGRELTIIYNRSELFKSAI